MVLYERRQPPPDRLEILRAQRVMRVGNASVVRTDGQIEIAVCFVEQKRHPEGAKRVALHGL